MSSDTQTLAATQEKAFCINMDKTLYGTFAEIGAGQETANWFFRSGGAAGTVAKTISAYDMTVSDTLYGPVRRYVSQERLLQMMDYEYKQLINRLGEKRGEDTRFFAFCNTVKCKGYRDNGPWSAWIGVRFQLRPQAEPSDLVMHVRLLVPDHDVQMRILGVLGVNLLHSLFYKREHMDEFVQAVGDNLDPNMFEIDYMRFSGNGFGMFDNRILALQLVRSGLSKATLFCPDGSVAQPADFLYKRPIVLMRGSFMPRFQDEDTAARVVGVPRVLVAVGLGADHADEERALDRFAGIVDDIGNVGLKRCVRSRDRGGLEAFEQLFEYHRSSYGCENDETSFEKLSDRNYRILQIEKQAFIILLTIV